MELEKTVIKSGNSSAVVLPKSWVGSQVLVKQIKKPVHITEDVMKILKEYLPEINGIYLVGSYARDNQNKNSDIDIVVITNSINKIIKSRPYEIVIMKQGSLAKIKPIEKLTLSSMMKDAKPLMGKYMLDKYCEKLKLTKLEKLKCYERLRDSLSRIEKLIDLAGKEKAIEGTSYSLILIYRALNYLIKDKNELTIEEIRYLGEVYKNYIKIRRNLKVEDKVNRNKVVELYNILFKKWEKGKKELKRQ